MSEVQSVLFDKKYWTLHAAIETLKKHGYKTDVDEKEHFYRFRQHDPEKFARMRTKKIPNTHMEFVIGFYKDQPKKVNKKNKK